ncbi:AAA family ATPase [Paracoccus sp. S-4012]|uniref:ParA family partition ATPase n=1 Tax=Paracoccus sp. S-4012 TaxID=2665648 RepID=UPI0012AF49FA|nr:ParA family partition ATPase [Paracoccus sp. S-4012]MRX50100.1 AAA family ATPase [Paracoccus sp. S-4012]
MGRIVTVAQQKGGSGKTTLTANLAVAARARGLSVAVIDTDPQGSLGRWFMERLGARGEDEGFDFATASAWGAAYEAEKVARRADLVLIDTPPKIDADLRPALRAASLVLVPVATSQVDLWATEGVLDLARRERRPCLIVLNRSRPGTRLAAEIAAAAGSLGALVARTRIGNRVAYAETMGRGMAVADGGAGPAGGEVEELLDEVLAAAEG